MNVLFICGQEFLRTKNKTNPFFDPIIDVCQKSGANWRILLPSRKVVSGYPQERVRNFGVYVKLGTLCWKLVHLLNRKARPENVYCWFGRVTKPFFAKLLDCDIAVTIAGYLEDEFQGMYPEKRVVELQHGVIYSKHTGYFNADASLRDKFREYKRREFWLYGQGYADCFFKNPKNHKWLDGRVKVIGDVLNAGVSSQFGVPNFESRKALVCMLQFNNSYPMNELLKMKELWEQYLETNRSVIEENNLDVLIRHHPRFGNVVDFSDWGSRFPWAHVDKRIWNEVYDDALCCVGFNSTTVIEAAGRGIPVIILDGSPIGKDSYFAETFVTDEFHYPFQNITLGEWVAYEEDKRSAVAKTLMQWHQRFYTPFDKENCLKLLKGER